MKRSSYFISARSVSADILASELILAMQEQYQRLDCYGILGEWTGRTRSHKLGDLKTFIQAGLHDSADPSVAAADLEAQLCAAISASRINLAILVGYSYLHHRLAAYLKGLGIPVVLYEITPTSALAKIDVKEVAGRVQVALGITLQASEFVQKTGMPYFYIGSPHKDRVDRVVIEAEALGLQAGVPLLSLFPAGRAENLRESFPLFEALAQQLSQDKSIQVVLSLAEGLDEGEGSLLQFAREAQAKTQDYKVVVGMHLELLSLSSLAVCGCGAITVECGLFQVPALAISSGGDRNDALKSLLNQTMGRAIVGEAHASDPLPTLLSRIRALIEAGPERSAMLAELQGLKLSLQGFAAENAAAYIGREIAHWQQSRKPKDSKTA